MTQRDFYNKILEANVSDEINTYAIAAIEKLDKAKERNKSIRAIKKLEVDSPIIEEIKKVLTEEPKTAKEIALAIEKSTQKTASVLKKMIAKKEVEQTVKTIKGKGKTKAYFIVT